MSFFEITVLVLLTLLILMTAAIFTKVCVPSREERTEAAVEEAMQRNTIEEGFENIMTYSVMGKTGFEELK